MSGFPGRIYDGEGIAMDRRGRDLTQERIDECHHRHVLAISSVSSVGGIWLLDDAARFNAIPPAIWELAISAVGEGVALLLLARRPEPLADVRDELLWCMEAANDLAAKCPDDVAGHA